MIAAFVLMSEKGGEVVNKDKIGGEKALTKGEK